MITNSSVLKVDGFDVDVVRKDIKNLHLGVYPPCGQVRVAAPYTVSDDAIRLAVIQRLPWIRKQLKKLEAQPRQSRREMIDGESHYVWGRRYLLRVIEDGSRTRVTFKGSTRLELHVVPGADRDARERRLVSWYREQLKAEIPGLIVKWAPLLDVAEPIWGVKRMKTRWGTCNVDKKRIWINLELAKKSPECLEFIVVHEMMHLIERYHTEHFFELMNQYLPQWRTVRDELNGTPLADENWQAREG